MGNPASCLVTLHDPAVRGYGLINSITISKDDLRPWDILKWMMFFTFERCGGLSIVIIVFIMMMLISLGAWRIQLATYQ